MKLNFYINKILKNKAKKYSILKKIPKTIRANLDKHAKHKSYNFI